MGCLGKAQHLRPHLGSLRGQQHRLQVLRKGFCLDRAKQCYSLTENPCSTLAPRCILLFCCMSPCIFGCPCLWVSEVGLPGLSALAASAVPLGEAKCHSPYKLGRGSNQPGWVQKWTQPQPGLGGQLMGAEHVSARVQVPLWASHIHSCGPSTREDSVHLCTAGIPFTSGL